MSRRRLALAAAAAVIALLLAAGAAAAFLVATEPGARWVLGRLLPPDVAVERVEGRLLGPLALHGLEVRAPAADVRVERVGLEWRAARLVRRSVEISSLELDGLAVRLRPADPDRAFELADFGFPLDVDVARLRVARLRVWPAGAEAPFELDELVISASGAGSDLRLHDLALRAPQYAGTARGAIRTRGDFPLELEIDWSARLPDLPPLAGSGRLVGTLLGELRLDHALAEPTAARLSAQITDPLGTLAWCADVEVPRFAFATVLPELAGHEASAVAALCGDLESASGTIDFDGRAEPFGELAGGGSVHYVDGTVRIEALRVTRADGGRIAVRGEVELGGETPVLRLTGEWADLRWPLTGPPSAASADGRFSFTGTRASYAVGVDAALAADGIPAGRWRLDGRGTPDALVVSRLTARLLDGEVTGGGRVAWAPEPSWDVRLAGRDLDPAPLGPDLDGSVGFELTSRGRVRGGVAAGDARVEWLEGTVRGIPFETRGTVAVDGDRYTLDGVEVVSGSGLLRLAGSVGTVWDARWELELPDLSALATFAPGLAGSLTGAGRLDGPRAAPTIEATASGRDLAYGETVVARAEAALHLDLADLGVSRIEARLDSLHAGAASADSVVLAGGGTAGDHRVALQGYTSFGEVDVELRGAIAQTRWDGVIHRLDLHTADVGTWGLLATAPLEMAAGSVRVPGLCWGSGEMEACLEAAWDADGGGWGDLSVTRLPLSLVNAWLPPDAELDGTLGLEARAEVDAEGAARAHARLAAGPGSLRFGPSGEGQPRRGYRTLRVDLDVDDREMRADLLFRLDDGNGFEGWLRAPRDVPPEQAPLAGNLAGEFHDRGLLGLLIDAVSATDGVLRLDLTAGGTLAAPGVAGRVALADARADLADLGLRLEAIEARAESAAGSEWALAAGFGSGEGRVQADGALRLASEAAPWNAELAISGERFEAYHTALARVIASPSLTLRAGPDRLELTGDLHVPRATITPEGFEPVVPVSPDVVVLGPDGAPDAAGAADVAPLAMRSQLRVVLGDSVFLDGYGLAGRLAGTLVVAMEPGRVTTGRGELRIVDGTFARFRQRVAIDEGRITFADGPIDNPGLDLRITRRSGDVLAGMNVGGTVRVPRVSLFSEPAMADTEALAYLLFGRPASLAGAQEGQVLQDAAASAGLAGGRLVAGRLGGTLGIQEARVEGESLHDASLYLGTYLTPRLYVGYGIGLFDTANLLRIRYQLAPAWVVQTESGTESGADLMYSVER